MAKSKNQEILEDIKKNDPRFKDMVIKKGKNTMPTYDEFFKEGNLINKKEVVYANEFHNNSK